jgi:RNA polymerase sigma-70 factor (ECF subfamily)
VLLTPPLTAEYVFENYAARVYSLAWRMLSNHADAEDVTQDVLLQVVRKLETFRGESELPTWLHRITVNAALAHRRRRAQLRMRPLAEPIDQFVGDARHGRGSNTPQETPDQQAISLEVRQLIDRAISRLPDMYRDVFVLSDVEGMPNLEIGEMLGLSLSAVKSRLHRGRLMMRNALAPYFQEVSV